MKKLYTIVYSVLIGTMFVGNIMARVEDQEVFTKIAEEVERQATTVNLIASENIASEQVRAVVGSELCNKYTEGYPKQRPKGMMRGRYYSGCGVYDNLEELTIARFKQVFGAEHVNVQPHAGSQANMAVYQAVLELGDTVLSMDLACGGHLTHGHSLNFSGQLYNFVGYGVNPDTFLIDYDEVLRLAREHKPKLIVAGASAYPRAIDFQKFREIADEVGALLMVDMAHIAGLVAAGVHASPIPYADIVTMTTHKTFRGPRGGVIMCKKEFARAIDRAVMPGIQGGALMNNVVAKAVACYEAMQPEYRVYQEQVVACTQLFAQELIERGYSVVTGGTDNHLFLVNVMDSCGLTGRKAEQVLESIGIYVNRNMLPYDQQPPLKTSGIRIGCATIVTQGATQDDIVMLASIVDEALRNYEDKECLALLKERIAQLSFIA